ncbi:MAG: hypothetical protein SNJ63_08365 [Sphingomonadaceae bacterium]
MSGSADPAALVARRMGHDLAAPLGALQMGLELGPEPDPVAREALAQAIARLEAFRELFGNDPDTPLDARHVRALLPQDASFAAHPSLPPRLVRAGAALAIDLAAHVGPPAMLRLEPQDGGGALVIDGNLAPLPASLAAVLAGADATEPRHAAAALCVRLAGPVRCAGATFLLA